MKKLTEFPRIELGLFPTPIQRLHNISTLLHTNVYVKRDDLTGLGLGGNKVRKLEYLLADAKQQGAETVFTTGGAQSNHAMLTAAASGKLEMKAILILKQRGVTDCVGNLLLSCLKVSIRSIVGNVLVLVQGELTCLSLGVGSLLGRVSLYTVGRSSFLTRSIVGETLVEL